MTTHRSLMHHTAPVIVIILYLQKHVSVTPAVNGGSNQLVSSVCVCPGYIATYECTVVGGFATVWQGSAFNCTGNEISLLHSRFMSNKKKIAECNDGAIVGQSLRVENNCYTSQLNVTVSYDMLGKNIECVQDDGRSTLGRMSTEIVKTTAPFPPPDKTYVYISLVDIGSRLLTFKWSPVAPDCPAIYYNILASNCGTCPTTTSHTTVTCTDIPSDHMCTFAVQTVFCGNTTKNLSDSIQISLKGQSENDVAVIATSFLVVLLFICVAICMTVMVIILIKYKQKCHLHLNKRTTTATSWSSAYEDVTARSSSKTTTIDTGKNVSYGQMDVYVQNI